MAKEAQHINIKTRIEFIKGFRFSSLIPFILIIKCLCNYYQCYFKNVKFMFAKNVLPIPCYQDILMLRSRQLHLSAVLCDVTRQLTILNGSWQSANESSAFFPLSLLFRTQSHVKCGRRRFFLLAADKSGENVQDQAGGQQPSSSSTSC